MMMMMMVLQKKQITKTDLYKTPLARIRAAEKALKETVFVKVSEDDNVSQSVAVICDTDADALEDILKGYMFSDEDYSLLKYEYPEIKNMKLTDVSISPSFSLSLLFVFF